MAGTDGRNLVVIDIGRIGLRKVAPNVDFGHDLRGAVVVPGAMKVACMLKAPAEVLVRLNDTVAHVLVPHEPPGVRNRSRRLDRRPTDCTAQTG